VIQQPLFQERLRIERGKRDEALDRLEVRRLYLINIAKDIAHRIVKKEGVVTSTEVLWVLREEYPEELWKDVDPRFMGAVFRSGWIKAGQKAVGSHCRPVTVWRLAA
jgi:hypothetical protein